MISIVIALIVVGALLYITQLLPIDATVKQIIYVIVVVGTILWLLQAFGVIGAIPTPVVR